MRLLLKMDSRPQLLHKNESPALGMKTLEKRFVGKGTLAERNCFRQFTRNPAEVVAPVI
jgi:hypothetical protein